MQIRLASDSDQPTWDAYVLAHPEGLAYQLWAWRQAVVAAYGFAGCYLLAEQHGRVRGILPLIEFRVPLLGGSLLSLPYCDAGGVLADEAEVAGRLLVRAGALAAERSLTLRLRSALPLPGAGLNHCDKVRMVLDLPENSEQLLAGLKSKLRSQVNKPLRDGLTVRLGAGELIADFYQVFAANMRDLGSPVHSRRWVEAVIAAYGERVRVAVVDSPNGLPAAAGLILLHPVTISIPWASSLRRYNSLNPNMLLYWTLLAFAADHGFSKFDFGRSTPGEGTWRFKEQWGAKSAPLYWQAFPPAPTPRRQPAFLGNLHPLVKSTWRHMPLSFCNALGPRVRRFVSL